MWKWWEWPAGEMVLDSPEKAFSSDTPSARRWLKRRTETPFVAEVEQHFKTKSFAGGYVTHSPFLPQISLPTNPTWFHPGYERADQKRITAAYSKYSGSLYLREMKRESVQQHRVGYEKLPSPSPRLSPLPSRPLINRSMWLTAWHMVCEAAWDGTSGVPCGY